jgi:hypothetical protein
MSNAGISSHMGGREGISMSSEASGYLHTLGALWTVYGAFRLAVAICGVIYGGTATAMFGALLSRAPNPFFLMSAFQVIYVSIIVFSLICGVLGLLAGLDLLGSQRGRTLVLVASFLALSDLPLGITLGIYTLFVLLR